MSSSDREKMKLGLDQNITRRDFLGRSLIGSGAVLLSQAAPLARAGGSPASNHAPSGSPWTGYGGVGDYAWSNGNTEAVQLAAHEVRDGKHDQFNDLPVEEEYDLIVVGGGFSGLSTAWEFAQQRQPDQNCLVLENHPIFGGEAKQNTFEVNGQLLSVPQGSNEAGVPPPPEIAAQITFIGASFLHYSRNWYNLGLPSKLEFQALVGGAEKIRIPNGHYAPMLAEDNYDVGYYFSDNKGGGSWAKNPMADHFASADIPAHLRKEYDEFTHNRRDVISSRDDVDRWLDSMTYKDLLEKELGYDPAITAFMDPLIAVGNYGVACDGISAYAAKRLSFSGTYPSDQPNPFKKMHGFTFEGGNTAVLRHLVKALVPRGIRGGQNFRDITYGDVDFPALDRKDNPINLRLNATAVRVEHEGKASSSESVLITYNHGGKLRRVRAKAVVLASGSWVNRRVVRDMPETHLNAYNQFNHGPVLTVNVALTNWRFMEKLGIAAARWFDGLGWHTTVRSYAIGPKGSKGPALHPDHPTVLTLYVPFLHPGYDTKTQGMLGRNSLLAKSYADIELEVRQQLTRLFGASGFDARRDIAGIILNRWGHAYVSPQPGFFFGKNGQPAPRDVASERFGRIAFAHSEFGGNQNMMQAMHEAHRATKQVMPLIS